MPRDERFFDLFDRHARTIVAGALRRMLEGGEAVAHCCQAVIAREREADQITREVMIADAKRWLGARGKAKAAWARAFGP